VKNQLSHEYGVGMPFEGMDIPNNRLMYIDKISYGQYTIQTGVHQGTKSSYFYFGQQSYAQPSTPQNNSCDNECE
jgi:hypothetical protein